MLSGVLNSLQPRRRAQGYLAAWVEIRFDPLLDLRECKVQTVGLLGYSFAIGGFNLRPLQNDLDKVAKNMIEEAINLFLDGPTHQEHLMRATALALKTTCTGGL